MLCIVKVLLTCTHSTFKLRSFYENDKKIKQMRWFQQISSYTSLEIIWWLAMKHACVVLHLTFNLLQSSPFKIQLITIPYCAANQRLDQLCIFFIPVFINRHGTQQMRIFQEGLTTFVRKIWLRTEKNRQTPKNLSKDWIVFYKIHAIER